jgi:Mrp family chromosome partitioning ATPase
MPVLAELPTILASHCAELVVDQPIALPARNLRALVERIAQQGPRVVAVTSVGPREAQTSFSVGLARAASQLGLRVILLDGNVQRPTIASRMGLASPRAGLLHVLNGAARLSQLMQKDSRSSALVLSAAAPGAAPQAIWSSPAVARMTAHLRRSADLVIIDAAQIAPGSELPLVARLADGVIVFAILGGAPPARLSPALDYVRSVTAAPVGLVLAP